MSRHLGGVDRQRLPELVFCPETSTRRQDVSQVIRQSLVHPEQGTVDWSHVAGVVEVNWRPPLAVPRVDIFVRHQARGGQQNAPIRQPTIQHAIVARLEMLHRVVIDFIPERKLHFVVVVTRAAKNVRGFFYQIRKVSFLLWRYRQGVRSLGDQVQIHRTISAQRNPLEMCARNHGRIH